MTAALVLYTSVSCLWLCRGVVLAMRLRLQCFILIGYAAIHPLQLFTSFLPYLSGADLHMAQLMPLPLTVSCFSKVQIGLPFWYRVTRVHTYTHTRLMALCPGVPAGEPVPER